MHYIADLDEAERALIAGRREEALERTFQVLEDALVYNARRAGLRESGEHTSAATAIEYLTARGLLTDFERSRFDDYREWRNTVAHHRLLMTASQVEECLSTVRRYLCRVDPVAGSFMRSSVVSVAPDDSVAVALRLLSTYAFTQLPVLEGERQVGRITPVHVLGALARGVAPAELLGRRVSDVMGPPLPEVPLATGAVEMARVLCGPEETALVVVDDDGALRGIVTRTDVLALATGARTRRLLGLEASTTRSGRDAAHRGDGKGKGR